ncbi:AzlC family ABC transporter permease [Frankia sp. CcWB2]
MRSSPPGVSQEAAFPMREIAAGFRATIPLAMGVAAYGLAMSAVAPTRDITLVQLLIMDAVVLAGSAQIVVVGLWGIPVPLAAILASTLIINLRYILLCASLREVFVGRPLWQKLLGIHLVADENWAVTLAEGRRRGRAAPPGFLLGGGLAILVFWLVGSGAGYLLGGRIPAPERFGLDFAFTTAFIALTRGFWRGRADVVPWLAAGVAAVVSWRLLGGTWYIMIGALVGAAAARRGPEPDPQVVSEGDAPGESPGTAPGVAAPVQAIGPKAVGPRAVGPLAVNSHGNRPGGNECGALRPSSPSPAWR